MFQFQHGAIGSALCLQKALFGRSFNSSMVRLGGSIPDYNLPFSTSFNSSMVRLGADM